MSPTKKKVTASGELRELRDFYFVFRFDEIIRPNKADKSLPSAGLLCPITRLESALFRTLPDDHTNTRESVRGNASAKKRLQISKQLRDRDWGMWKNLRE